MFFYTSTKGWHVEGMNHHNSFFSQKLLTVIFCFVYFVPTTLHATIHNVPTDFPTIQAAINAASGTDTVLIAPGTYSENLTISAHDLTIGSNFLMTQDETFINTTILDGGGGGNCIFIQNGTGSGTTIIGITIQNAGDGIEPRAHFNLLYCRVTNTTDGVDYENEGGGLVAHCVFENNNDDGIDLDGRVDVVIENNIIRNNNDDGIEIRLHNYTGPTLFVHIRDNVIHGNGEDGIQFIDYDELTDRQYFVERNLIYNNTDAGIGCMGNANTIENFEGHPIRERIFVFNNTISDHSHGITGGDSLVAVNNIIVNSTVLGAKNVSGGSIIAYADFFGNGTDVSNCNLDGSTNIFLDPDLDTNMDLLSTSPCIDAGTAAYTWEGETVLNMAASEYEGLAPDIGAREFQPVALPVELSEFNATIRDCRNVLLHWTTLSEQNNDFFEIQRSTDAVNFTTVGRVDGHGNSAAINNYGFLEKNLSNENFYYRLRQVDLDGRFAFSKIIAVQVNCGTVAFSIFPNPTNNNFNLAGEFPKGKNVQIELYDHTGKLVQNWNLHNPSVTQNFNQEFDISNFPKGIYSVKINAEGRIIWSEKLVRL